MVDDTYTVEHTVCRKCGRTHRVDSYRGVKFYLCPDVNRVILMMEKKDEKVRESTI
jgi:hypothetical protein